MATYARRRTSGIDTRVAFLKTADQLCDITMLMG